MNHICEKIELWSPCDDLLINNSEQKYALIVLNCQIDSNIDPNKLLNLWKEGKLYIVSNIIILSINISKKCKYLIMKQI